MCTEHDRTAETPPPRARQNEIVRPNKNKTNKRKERRNLPARFETSGAYSLAARYLSLSTVPHPLPPPSVTIHFVEKNGGFIFTKFTHNHGTIVLFFARYGTPHAFLALWRTRKAQKNAQE